MPVRSQIVTHAKVKEIEAAIVLRVKANDIAATYGVTAKSVFLHRANMKKNRLQYYRALRQALESRGISKSNHLWGRNNVAV